MKYQIRMSCPVVPAIAIALTALLLGTASACAAAGEAVFVDAGQAVSVAQQAGDWKQTESGLRAGGKEALLLAGQGVGEGDFHITAELAIENLAGSAATFVLGDSHFGFATSNDELFLTGGQILNGAYGTPIGKTGSHLRDGESFSFEVTRQGDQLSFLIDGQMIHQRSVTTGPVGRIGFMPWRSVMTIQSFRANGNLDPQLARYQPPEPVMTKEVRGVEKTVLLPPGPGNPRNSEGDFITLDGGRIMFIYTHFTGGAGDHATAHLAARVSDDGGRTWAEEDAVIVPNESGLNVMSVSLLRLDDGRIALFYIQKNSTKDCRPVMRVSDDEAQTWSEPAQIIPNSQVGYYVLNNDRVIQLQDGPHKGRLIVPVAQHDGPGVEWHPGIVMCYFSDDLGQSWQRSDAMLKEDAQGKRIDLQEPGVVELKDGRLLLFIRTAEGSQYLSYSSDGGNTWTDPRPSNLYSPLSPASIERIPTTGDLLLVWNNHRDIPRELAGRRTPFNVAISKDEGKTWVQEKVLEDHPNGWYCYTAIHFVDGQVLLGHCAGNHRDGGGLNTTQITRFSVNWLYE